MESPYLFPNLQKYYVVNFVDRGKLHFPRHFDFFTVTKPLSQFLLAVITGTTLIYCARATESFFSGRDILWVLKFRQHEVESWFIGIMIIFKDFINGKILSFTLCDRFLNAILSRFMQLRRYLCRDNQYVSTCSQQLDSNQWNDSLIASIRHYHAMDNNMKIALSA